MKFYVITLLVFLSMNTRAISQSAIINETFGSPIITTPVATYTGYSNYPTLLYTGTADVRQTVGSTGYATASGSGNVFITNTVGTNLQISKINTSASTGLSLSLGLLKTKSASTGSELGIEVSSDSITWTQLTFSLPSGYGTENKYYYITPTGSIPSVPNLHIRFRMKTSVSGLYFRVDDVYLTKAIPLPIELIDFFGQASILTNVLQWNTASETNNDYFSIQKSADGNSWTEIGRLAGSHNSTSIRKYTWIDDKPFDEISYYRLKQVDIDGKYSYSKIIAIVRKSETHIVVYYNQLGQIVQNPITGNLYIKFENGKGTLIIYQK